MKISLQMRRPEILNQNILMAERRINLCDWSHLVDSLIPVLDFFSPETLSEVISQKFMTMKISLQMRRPEILNQNIFTAERRINLCDWNHLVNFLIPVFEKFSSHVKIASR